MQKVGLWVGRLLQNMHVCVCAAALWLPAALVIYIYDIIKSQTRKLLGE